MDIFGNGDVSAHTKSHSECDNLIQDCRQTQIDCYAGVPRVPRDQSDSVFGVEYNFISFAKYCYERRKNVQIYDSGIALLAFLAYILSRSLTCLTCSIIVHEYC